MNESKIHIKGNRKDRQIDFFELRYEYGDYLYSYQLELIRLHHETAIELLHSKSIKKNYIVDIGCACGDFTYRLANTFQSSKIIGMDLINRGLEEARKRYPKQIFLKSALPNIPLANESMDVVVCMEVLYYLKEDSYLLALKDISRILKPKGYLLISTTIGENRNYFDIKRLANIGSSYFDPINQKYEYLSSYTKIMKLLQKLEKKFLKKSCIHKAILNVRKSKSLGSIGGKFGKVRGKKEISNGAFLLMKKEKVKAL